MCLCESELLGVKFNCKHSKGEKASQWLSVQSHRLPAHRAKGASRVKLQLKMLRFTEYGPMSHQPELQLFVSRRDV